MIRDSAHWSVSCNNPPSLPQFSLALAVIPLCQVSLYPGRLMWWISLSGNPGRLRYQYSVGESRPWWTVSEKRWLWEPHKDMEGRDGEGGGGGSFAYLLVSPQPLEGHLWKSTSIGLVVHRSSSIPEGRMLTTSFLHPSFLQAISAVMLWCVHVEKVPQASQHLCAAKLETSCQVSYAFQSICQLPTVTAEMIFHS